MVVVSFFLVFFAIAVVGAVLFLGTGIARSSRNAGAGLDEPVPNLPPVLLPAGAKASDVDRVRFALGLRGYRMDQVDEVLDELRDQLTARETEIDRLKRALEAAGNPEDPKA
ncbi:DivIVA domain-containing protein [Arthrobacter sp. MMS18-M83]|uniref:DivIVA domain-containing protein n=1 Tax=Arthrobacter sp. MMS18-M83 TaxID=2996261 RepID=UPI00227B5C1F|nr:DivIVA domain-containing protein [Arthrobacter sp. MMS18-M83]WAH96422.1 DivIVA domain-containing protein [Arthrobacter sp. MMS18-M83]